MTCHLQDLGTAPSSTSGIRLRRTLDDASHHRDGAWILPKQRVLVCLDSDPRPPFSGALSRSSRLRQVRRADAGFAWSLEQLNDDLMGFMDATGTRKAHFIGESMGGMVMPSIYRHSGERILSITACSSNIGLRGVFAKEMAGGSASMTEAITSAPTLQHYIRKTEASRLAPDEVDEAARAGTPTNGLTRRAMSGTNGPSIWCRKSMSRRSY